MKQRGKGLSTCDLMFVLWANSSSFLFFAGKGVHFLYSLVGEYGIILLTYQELILAPSRKLPFWWTLSVTGFVLTKGKDSVTHSL